MGLRFRRSVRLLPGLRLNLGLRGVSLSAGVRGASVTLGRQGLYGNVGIPGTGLSVREKLKPPSLPSFALSPLQREVEETHSLGLRLELDEDGRLRLTTPDGAALPDAIERVVRRDGEGQLRAWLAEECEKRNGGAGGLLALHLDTPFGAQPFVPEPFDEPYPEHPALPTIGFWDRLFPSRQRRKTQEYEAALTAYAAARAAWQAAKVAHEEEQARLRWRSETGRLEDENVMEELLEEALSGLSWPRETMVDFELSLAGRLLHLDVDLPEVEEMPRQIAEVAQRGLKLNLRQRSETQVRKLYAQHIHGVLYRVVAVAFATLPRLQRIVCSGYSQCPNPATGQAEDHYLLSAVVERAAWVSIVEEDLSRLDPVAFLGSCQLRRDMTATGIFRPIDPFKPDGRPSLSPSGENAPDA